MLLCYFVVFCLSLLYHVASFNARSAFQICNFGRGEGRTWFGGEFSFRPHVHRGGRLWSRVCVLHCGQRRQWRRWRNRGWGELLQCGRLLTRFRWTRCLWCLCRCRGGPLGRRGGQSGCDYGRLQLSMHRFIVEKNQTQGALSSDERKL